MMGEGRVRVGDTRYSLGDGRTWHEPAVSSRRGSAQEGSEAVSSLNHLIWGVRPRHLH
jgi:hypothetical protein